MTEWIEYLHRLVTIVDEQVEANRAATGNVDLKNYDEWRKRSATADQHMLTFFQNGQDARFTRPGNDYAVRMAGIRAASTCGWTAALQNWKRSAERKIAEAEKAAGVLAS
jgi:hypothetical protein